jgi:hypothetical protein
MMRWRAHLSAGTSAVSTVRLSLSTVSHRVWQELS